MTARIGEGKTLSTTAFILVLCLAIHMSHLEVARVMARSSNRETASVLPRADLLKFLSLGYDQLVADCWWLAFIQYYGDHKKRLKEGYGQSYAYLDLITQLDPHFTEPYWFAAFAVGAEMKRPELAQTLIERGIENNQNNWCLPFIAGINQYLFAKNDTRAAKYYRMASSYPDAPRWLSRQAKILEARMPTLIKEIKIWQSVYESAQEPMVKGTAKEKLVRLWVRVYREIPSDFAKFRAREELKMLGVDVEQALGTAR